MCVFVFCFVCLLIYIECVFYSLVLCCQNRIAFEAREIVCARVFSEPHTHTHVKCISKCVFVCVRMFHITAVECGVSSWDFRGGAASL